MKKLFLIIFIVLLTLVVAAIYFTKQSPATPDIKVQKPESEAFPSNTEETDSNLEPPSKVDDLIILESPRVENTVSSPLVVRGEARGTWFFEATFPVILTDWDGRIIAETYATAQDEWMTEAYVPFEATIEFDVDTSVSNRGSLILQKANPSDLPENDNALEITIYFE